MIKLYNKNLVVNDVEIHGVPKGKKAIVFGFVFKYLEKDHQIMCANSFEQDKEGMFVDEGLEGEELKNFVIKNYKSSIKLMKKKAKEYTRKILIKQQIKEDK